jgi:hypothetical protein
VNSLDPLPRTAEAALEAALRRFPVVALTGARQTGKTTLARDRVPGAKRLFRTLDDLDVLDAASRDPARLLEGNDPITLDEVQRAPGLLLAVKRAVDRERKPGRFLLTGSANLLLMRRVSESLAGRAVYFQLGPLTEGEKAGRPAAPPWSELLRARSLDEARGLFRKPAPLPDWPARALAGGFPRAALAADVAERRAWFDGYVRTYLERDLQQIAAIQELPDFRRLMRTAALREGQVLNQSALARDAGLSQATAHRYLNLLETTYQIIRIPAFKVSRTARLVKAPRLYAGDTGLGAHLAGLEDEAALRSHPGSGAFLEGLVLAAISAWRDLSDSRPEILYWRTQSGQEVDFVLETSRRLLPVEVKASSRATLDDAAGLLAFLQEHGARAPFGLLLHTGADVVPLTSRVLAVPVAPMLGLG